MNASEELADLAEQDAQMCAYVVKETIFFSFMCTTIGWLILFGFAALAHLIASKSKCPSLKLFKDYSAIEYTPPRATPHLLIKTHSRPALDAEKYKATSELSQRISELSGWNNLLCKEGSRIDMLACLTLAAPEYELPKDCTEKQQEALDQLAKCRTRYRFEQWKIKYIRDEEVLLAISPLVGMTDWWVRETGRADGLKWRTEYPLAEQAMSETV